MCVILEQYLALELICCVEASLGYISKTETLKKKKEGIEVLLCACSLVHRTVAAAGLFLWTWFI